MSRFIHLLNTIKKNIAHLPLTPSQERCVLLIQERLLYPGVVNLYGLTGVGKTMLGWHMAWHQQATYVVGPDDAKQANLLDSSVVLVDNVGADRTTFRRLMAKLELTQAERLIVFTDSPVDDYVFRIELVLSDEDVSVVQTNFERLGYRVTQQSYANLWHLVRQTIQEE